MFIQPGIASSRATLGTFVPRPSILKELHQPAPFRSLSDGGPTPSQTITEKADAYAFLIRALRMEEK